MGQAPASVRQTARRRALVSRTRIGGLPIRTAWIASRPRGADAPVVDAHVVSKATAAKHGWLRSSAPGRDEAALRPSSEARTRVLGAPASEILTVGSAFGSRRTAPAVDRSVAAVGQRPALDGNPERGELRNDLLAGSRLAGGLLRVVAPAVAAPTEVVGWAIGRLTAGEEPIRDVDVAACEGNHHQHGRQAQPHQNLPRSEIPLGPMLTSGNVSS
jgi:hypothetical protein